MSGLMNRGLKKSTEEISLEGNLILSHRWGISYLDFFVTKDFSPENSREIVSPDIASASGLGSVDCYDCGLKYSHRALPFSKAWYS